MTVLQLVERERSRLRSKLVMSVGAVALAGAAAALALGVVVLGGSRWIWLPRAAPFVFWVLLVATFMLAVVQVIRVGRSQASQARVAQAIEKERKLRDGSLRGVIEVSQSSALARRASDLMATSLGMGEKSAAGLAPRMQRGARVRMVGGAGAALAGVVALSAATGTNPDGWNALTHPMSAWNGTLAAPLVIDAPSAVMRGEKVEILIAAAARRNVKLYHRSTGNAWREGDYKVGEDANARAVLGPVDADMMLVAGDGRSLSDTVILRVTDRPFVGDVAIKAIYPKYLSKPDEALPIGEAAVVPRGTILEVSGHASVQLAKVALVRDERDTTDFIVDGHRFRGRLAAREDGQWLWHARGQTTPIQDVPPPLDLRVVPDSAPAARIIWPTGDTLLAADQKLDIELAATDDHALKTVVLKSWKLGPVGASRVEQAMELADAPGAAWSSVIKLDLSTRGLKAGDELRVVLVATDGSPWQQSGTSRELVIRIPTTSEQRELARSAADSAVAEAMAAAGAQRELEQKTSEASRSRDAGGASAQSSGKAAGEQSMSYEAAEKMKSLAGSQREIEEQVENLKRAAAQMEEQLRQAGALDSGLASRIAEARQLLNQAMTSELRDHLQKLEQAAQQLSQDQTRRSLADLMEQQKKLREQLEKSAGMLQRAAFEGAMQTLSDEAKELAGKEKALADSLAKRAPAPQQDAKALEAQSQALKKEMEELAKKLAEAGADPGAKRTEEAAKQAQQALDALQKLNQSMSQDQPGKAGQGQQQAGQGQQQAGQRQGGTQQQQQQGTGAGQQQQQQSAQQQQQQQQNAQAAADAMQRAADEMSKARSEQIGEWKSEVTKELDRAIQEMQQLARQQERVEQQMRQGTDPGSLKGDQSAIQQGVQKVNERLQQSGQKSSLFSQQSQKAAADAQSKVQQATQQMGGSKAAGETANSMRESANAMQQAATALARDRERANNAKSASGFQEMIEEIQQLAQQQGGLNTMSQGLLQKAGDMTAQQREREAAAIARQQRELARRMEELADASGRSEALATEARKIAASLDAGLLDQATVLRQQALFRRLLEAGRTLEQGEEDSTGRRESKAATGDLRFAPQGTSSKGAPAVRFKEPGWEELRGLTADERRQVLDYFKRINGGGS